MTNMGFVEISGLTKEYGKKTVLSQLDLTIGKGQIIGLLGPNGSGKTTLVKILTGLIKDYKGIVRIDGNMPNVYTKSIVSYLPESFYFGKWMKVKDALQVFEDFYQDFDRKKAEEMTKQLGLELKMPVRAMSKGMKEKLQLILVMSRRAKLYVLDEPLGGVDPSTRDFILDTILNQYSEESSILMSTHLIHDVERIFDKVIFLKNGSAAIYEDVDTLREERGMSIDELYREVYR